MNEIDAMDKQLLNLIQSKLPLSSTPFADMGEILQIPEQEVIARLERLKQQKHIRRIGAIFDSARMGYYSTLCACKVEESRLDQVAAIINAQPGITHNYTRENSRNLWFTLTASSKSQALDIIEQLEKEAGINIDSMPAKKVYKIKVSFEMGDQGAV